MTTIQPDAASRTDTLCEILEILTTLSLTGVDAVDDAGAITAVTRAMCALPHDAELQWYGCMALARLMEREARCSLAASCSLGAAASVVAAMRTHPTTALVQHWGCSALWCLAESGSHCRTEACAAGACAAMTALLRTMPPELCTGAAQEPVVVYDALFALVQEDDALARRAIDDGVLSAACVHSVCWRQGATHTAAARGECATGCAAGGA